MLRIAAAVAAMALGWATLELRSLIDVNTSVAEPRPMRVDQAHLPIAQVDPGVQPVRPERANASRRTSFAGGVPRTARALEAALARRGLVEHGRAWLGKLDGVGGGRDTLVYVPDALDPARTIELVVYMEGHGSFADDAMDHRHASSIARLVERGGNVAYVAPDAPSSAHGNRTAKSPYWVAGCAARRCAGGHAAPGDFLVFLDQAIAKVGELAGADADARSLDVRLHLVGFSNGGKGVWGAVKQLEHTDVAVSEVVFADGNYGGAWLGETWAILAARGASLTILVIDGSFTGADRAGGNRRRAAAFLRATERSPRIRLVALRATHHGVGDAAVDYLQGLDVLAGS